MKDFFPATGDTVVVYTSVTDCGPEIEDGECAWHWFSFECGPVTYHYDAVDNFCYATAPTGCCIPGFEVVESSDGDDRFEPLEGRSVGFVKA